MLCIASNTTADGWLFFHWKSQRIVVILSVLNKLNSYHSQNGKTISWKLVETLYFEDVDMGGLYINKKLKHEHVYLTSFSKMKVKLAAQVC